MHGFALEDKWCFLNCDVSLIVVKWPIWFYQLWLWRERNDRGCIKFNRWKHSHLILPIADYSASQTKCSLDLLANVLVIWGVLCLSEWDVRRAMGLSNQAHSSPLMWHRLLWQKLKMCGSDLPRGIPKRGSRIVCRLQFCCSDQAACIGSHSITASELL